MELKLFGTISLKDARTLNHLTIEQVAKKAGINPRTLYNWESGKSEPMAGKLKRVCKIYGMSMDQVDMSPWQ